MISDSARPVNNRNQAPDLDTHSFSKFASNTTYIHDPKLMMILLIAEKPALYRSKYSSNKNFLQPKAVAPILA